MAFDPSWAAAHPVRTIPTYPGTPVALPAASPNGAPDLGADALRDELRALGYIE